MSDLFYQLGRRLGHAAIPAVRKTRIAYHLLAGTQEESLRAEAQLGSTMAQELLQFSHAVPNQALTTLLNEICERLAATLQHRSRSFAVNLIEGGSPAAVGLPGGYIFVDTLLVDICEVQPDQLAFVVGHEMGHIIRKHTIDRLLASVGIKVISGLVSRGGLGAWWRQGGQELLEKAHGREQEFQADEYGFRMMLAAGYDPQRAFNLLGRLETLRHTQIGLSEYLRSHPPEAERIERLRRLIEPEPQ